MDFSTEQIKQIEELAAILTPISDMAVLLDVDVDELRNEIRPITVPKPKLLSVYDGRNWNWPT